MNKRATTELIFLGLVAAIAVVGLVIQFSGLTGMATGQPQTREVPLTSDEYSIEQAGGYTCMCSGVCVFDQREERVQTSITEFQRDAIRNCKTALQAKCRPQAVLDYKYMCLNR